MLKAAALNLFRILAGAYGVIVAELLLMRVITGEGYRVVVLLNAVIHLIVLPVVVLLPLALILRRWGIAALLLPALAAVVLWYGPPLLPPDILDVPDDSPRLTIATFNIYRWSGAEGDDILRIIRDMDADVVLLQELHIDGAARIEAELADLYPYMVLRPDPDNPIAGGGTLSRYPIVADDLWRTTTHDQLHVEIEFAGLRVAIYNLHLAYPYNPDGLAERDDDVYELLARARSEAIPVIVAGDFNLTERGGPYGAITDSFTDAYRAAGRGAGWTYVPLPHLPGDFRMRLVRIDYVFYGPRWVALSARVWGDAATSDHHPLLVTLALAK